MSDNDMKYAVSSDTWRCHLDHEDLSYVRSGNADTDGNDIVTVMTGDGVVGYISARMTNSSRGDYSITRVLADTGEGPVVEFLAEGIKTFGEAVDWCEIRWWATDGNGLGED